METQTYPLTELEKELLRKSGNTKWYLVSWTWTSPEGRAYYGLYYLASFQVKTLEAARVLAAKSFDLSIPDLEIISKKEYFENLKPLREVD